MPWYQRSTLGRRAFSVAGPTVWNSILAELRDEPEDVSEVIENTVFLDNISVLSALEVFYDNVLYKSTFTYLLTYSMT